MRRVGEEAEDDSLAKKLLDEEETPSAKHDASTVQPAAPPAEPAKEMSWDDRVKAAGLTPDQAFTILNAILENGFYTKEFALYGGRLKLTLRTRDGYSRQRISNALDELRTNDPRVQYQTQARLALAGSILSFKDKIFKHVSSRTDIVAVQEAFNERLMYIDGIDDTLLDNLLPLVARFDAWTYAAMSNGAPTGF